MRTENHPYDFPLAKIFPERRLLAGLEGGSVWLAEKDDKFYVILDEGGMADFLMPGEDDDLLDQMVKVHVFDAEVEREQYIEERGWTKRDI